MACALVCIALGLHGAGFAKPYAFGWRRVGCVSVQLVEIVRSNTVGRLGLFPGQLAWLVVIRDVSLPDLGPHGRVHRDFVGWLGVFVRTDNPRYIVATSF
jgi:hypothetical protein